MIENPREWFEAIVPYVKKPKDPRYGDLCIIGEAPADVYDKYLQYIKLCSKLIQTWDEAIMENLTIIGFSEDNEQTEIATELFKMGLISRRIIAR